MLSHDGAVLDRPLVPALWPQCGANVGLVAGSGPRRSPSSPRSAVLSVVAPGASPSGLTGCRRTPWHSLCRRTPPLPWPVSHRRRRPSVSAARGGRGAASSRRRRSVVGVVAAVPGRTAPITTAMVFDPRSPAGLFPLDKCIRALEGLRVETRAGSVSCCREQTGSEVAVYIS